MKRFYEQARVEARDGAEFAVMLDERPVQTPARNLLQVASPALADAIAAEWDCQEDDIVPARMPLTQVAATALDRVAPDTQTYARQIAVYGETDLLCYRAQAPQSLVVRQAATWQPLVDWAADRFAAPLTVTEGVSPIAQPAETLIALENAVRAHDPFEMAALGLATTAAGSLVIALALSHAHIDADAAFAAGFLDESWQAEQWGIDEEAERRRAIARADLETAARFLALHRQR